MSHHDFQEVALIPQLCDLICNQSDTIVFVLQFLNTSFNIGFTLCIAQVWNISQRHVVIYIAAILFVEEVQNSNEWCTGQRTEDV